MQVQQMIGISMLCACVFKFKIIQNSITRGCYDGNRLLTSVNNKLK